MWCKCLPDIWTSYQNGHMLEVISYTGKTEPSYFLLLTVSGMGLAHVPILLSWGMLVSKKIPPPSVNMHPRRHTWPNSLTHECFLFNLGFSHNHINVMAKLQQLRLLMASNKITWLNGCQWLARKSSTRVHLWPLPLPLARSLPSPLPFLHFPPFVRASSRIFGWQRIALDLQNSSAMCMDIPTHFTEKRRKRG